MNAVLGAPWLLRPLLHAFPPKIRNRTGCHQAVRVPLAWRLPEPGFRHGKCHFALSNGCRNIPVIRHELYPLPQASDTHPSSTNKQACRSGLWYHNRDDGSRGGMCSVGARIWANAKFRRPLRGRIRFIWGSDAAVRLAAIGSKGSNSRAEGVRWGPYAVMIPSTRNEKRLYILVRVD